MERNVVGAAGSPPASGFEARVVGSRVKAINAHSMGWEAELCRCWGLDPSAKAPDPRMEVGVGEWLRLMAKWRTHLRAAIYKHIERHARKFSAASKESSKKVRESPRLRYERLVRGESLDASLASIKEEKALNPPATPPGQFIQAPGLIRDPKTILRQ